MFNNKKRGAKRPLFAEIPSSIPAKLFSVFKKLSLRAMGGRLVQKPTPFSLDPGSR